MLKGRINRRTFLAGNLIALAILIMVCLLIVLPTAILDLVINSKASDVIFQVLYYSVALPGVIYLVYICIMMIRRAHDFNMPGLLMVTGFVLLLVLGKMTGVNMFNLFAVIMFIALMSVPGSKNRNSFGLPPRKKLRLADLKIQT